MTVYQVPEGSIIMPVSIASPRVSALIPPSSDEPPPLSLAPLVSLFCSKSHSAPASLSLNPYRRMPFPRTNSVGAWCTAIRPATVSLASLLSSLARGIAGIGIHSATTCVLFLIGQWTCLAMSQLFAKSAAYYWHVRCVNTLIWSENRFPS